MPEQQSPQPLPLQYATPTHANRIVWRTAVLHGVVFLALVVLFAALVFPSAPRARVLDSRLVSASRLRSIGQGILLYQNDFNGQFPGSLITLTHAEDITTDSLISPASNDVAARGATTQAVDADFAMPGHCSYVYLGRGMMGSVSTRAVIAYERPGIFPQGSNVLFGDGHVEFMPARWVAQLRMAVAARPWPSTQPIIRPPA